MLCKFVVVGIFVPFLSSSSVRNVKEFFFSGFVFRIGKLGVYDRKERSVDERRE